MQIRPERASEHGMVETIHALAFGGQREAKVVARARRSKRHLPDLSLVAVLDERLVGHVLFSRVGLEDEYGVLRLASVLGPLAVHPEFQHQGVGAALIEAGLEQLENLHEALVIVRGRPQYYAHFGFVPAEQVGIGAPFATQPGEYMVKPLGAYKVAWRGTVRYPVAFCEVGYPTQFE